MTMIEAFMTRFIWTGIFLYTCVKETKERKIIQFIIEGDRAAFDQFHVDAEEDMREYTG